MMERRKAVCASPIHASTHLVVAGQGSDEGADAAGHGVQRSQRGLTEEPRVFDSVPLPVVEGECQGELAGLNYVRCVWAWQRLWYDGRTP